MDSAVLSQFRSIIGDDQVLDSAEDLSVYAYDGTATLRVAPACVLLPETVQQVAAILTVAHSQRLPVITRGSGTGLAGGAVPVEGGIVLCLVRMDRIIEVDEANLAMVVEPGVITQRVADAAAAAGLFYPPDPGSIKISTIGGNVANNSGGLRGLKYGVTRDYVMALQVVLADGQILNTGTKCVKDVAGFTLKDLFIGSEGTLGVITSINLKLIPPPAAKQTMIAHFESMSDAARTVSESIRHKFVPCSLEFLDRVTIGCVEEYVAIGLPLDVEALLLMEVDGHPAEVAEQAAEIERLAGEHGAREVRRAHSEEEATRLASARRTAFSALARLAPTVVLEDVTVPRSELARMVSHIAQVSERYGVRIGTFGHMGDGNLHPTFLTDERDAREMGRVEQAMREVFEFAVELGGTITGEHGVGLAKKPFLPAAIGPVAMDITRRLKADFDPEGILNPGKIFD